MNKQEKYSRWEDLVSRTARFVARDFPEVDEEDLFQDVMLEVLTNDKLVNPDDFGMPTALSRFATKKAWEYRTQGLYLSVQYAYRPSDVKRILQTVFLDEGARFTYQPEDMESFYEDDRLVANSDIKYAFDRLPPQYKEIIFKVFALKWEFDNNSAERKRLNRAIDRMVQILNTYNKQYEYHGPGARKAISNATARSIINRQENGWAGG